MTLYRNVDARQGYVRQSSRHTVLGEPVKRFCKTWKLTPWFERVLCFYIGAGTGAVIIHSFGGF